MVTTVLPKLWEGSCPNAVRWGLSSVLVTLLVAGSLAGTPASHAATAPPSPTGLTMTWTTAGPPGESYRAVRLSWRGADPAASYNWHTQVFDGSTWVSNGPSGSTSPGVTGVSTLSEGMPYRATVRFAVNAVQGGVAGPTASSVPFDTNGPLPRVESVIPRADGSVQMTWIPNLPGPDSTPNDPLDLVGPYHYQVVTEINPEAMDAVGPSTTALSARFTPAIPARVGVANDNEWKPVASDRGRRFVYFDEADSTLWSGTNVSAAVPGVGTYSLPMAVNGRVTRIDRQCLASFPSCELITSPGAGRQVVLHARNLPTTPWYAVTTTTSDANGRFQMRVNAPGTRQYRVLVLGVPWPNTQHGYAQAGAMTTPVASTTVTRVVSAHFTDPSAYRGQKVTAALRVLPAGTQRATLQRWTGTDWVNMKWVYLTDGIGSYTFTAVQRGTVGYRFVIPASTTSSGLPVGGATTAPFYLTTA